MDIRYPLGVCPIENTANAMIFTLFYTRFFISVQMSTIDPLGQVLAHRQYISLCKPKSIDEIALNPVSVGFLK